MTTDDAVNKITKVTLGCFVAGGVLMWVLDVIIGMWISQLADKLDLIIKLLESR